MNDFILRFLAICILRCISIMVMNPLTQVQPHNTFRQAQTSRRNGGNKGKSKRIILTFLDKHFIEHFTVWYSQLSNVRDTTSKHLIKNPEHLLMIVALDTDSYSAVINSDLFNNTMPSNVEIVHALNSSFCNIGLFCFNYLQF